RGRGPDGLLPRDRAAELRHLAIELLARLAGELGEQLRARRPVAGGGERLAERLGDRERARPLLAAAHEELDRVVELADGDQAVGGAQARAIALGIGGDGDVDL